MKYIKAQDLKLRLDKNDVLLVDVREPAEFRSETIEGACSIPLAEFSSSKIPTTSKPVVVLCMSGRRSGEAVTKLESQAPQIEVYCLEGGLGAWQQAGFGTKKSGSTMLPLDRQTQLAVGFFVFSGVLLGALVHQAFYVIPGFFGLGLMSAGLTGWCGMAKLLARMPWNK